MYAIDFNTAPGLAPLKDILTAAEIVVLLKESIQFQRIA